MQKAQQPNSGNVVPLLCITEPLEETDPLPVLACLQQRVGWGREGEDQSPGRTIGGMSGNEWDGSGGRHT